MVCKICHSDAPPFGRGEILGKYQVQYFRCQRCGFVQCEEPYWLSESYSQAIAVSDVGLVRRNVRLAAICTSILAVLFPGNGRFLDYGGGYGLFVRLMRDLGFDFYRYDKFCENLFAPGCDVDVHGDEQFQLVTAFEVFEHLVNPREEIERMLRFSRSILFSTQLVPGGAPKPGEWWYYALDSGQHVSLYSLESLRVVARSFELNYYPISNSLHLLSDRPIRPAVLRLVSSRKGVKLVNLLVHRRPLTSDDYLRLTGRRLADAE